MKYSVLIKNAQKYYNIFLAWNKIIIKTVKNLKILSSRWSIIGRVISRLVWSIISGGTD